MSAPDLFRLPERFRSRIEVWDGHWLWTGQINNKGYGVIHAKDPRQPAKPTGKRAAHLVVWELLVGLVPDGHELDHTCVYKRCVIPGCTEPVTHAENQRRSSWRQTHCRRAGHPRIGNNVYVDPTTGRTRCRPCMREADQHRVPRRRGVA